MKYDIGDVVVKQSQSFGQQLVRVTSKDKDIKNNLPGFDGVLVDTQNNEIEKDSQYGNKIWGYDHQIVKIWKKVCEH